MHRALTLAAWALLPAAADMLPLTPELCVALGQEPYTSIAEEGLPLPPTMEQINALPATELARQQDAIKETLLLRWALIRQAGNRTNKEVETASAGLARSAEAPEIVAEIYQCFADGDLSRVQEHLWNDLLDEVLHAYRIDALAVRLLVTEADLTPEDAVDLAPFLPLTDAFNLVPLRPPTEAEMLADLRVMQREYAALTALYADVQDKESAEKAAAAARPVVQRLLTTNRTLFRLKDPQTQLTPELSDALKAANASYAALNAQRTRLQETHFASSPLLRALDILAE